MAILAAVLLGVLALAFVLYPLYRPTTASFPHEAPVTDEVAVEKKAPAVLSEWTEREQAAKSAIQEVELDYQLGNIDNGDYQELRERYMRRALTALASRYDREQEIDAEIEEQLRKMRGTQESEPL